MLDSPRARDGRWREDMSLQPEANTRRQGDPQALPAPAGWCAELPEGYALRVTESVRVGVGILFGRDGAATNKTYKRVTVFVSRQP